MGLRFTHSKQRTSGNKLDHDIELKTDQTVRSRVFSHKAKTQNVGDLILLNNHRNQFYEKA